MSLIEDFYDGLSPFYHLIYPDWESSVDRQGRQLADLIRNLWGSGAKSVLDVSCGIGTQSLGLAAEGFTVTGSDLSPASIDRARQEAASRGLDIRFSVCDMRKVEAHHPAEFDVVISADNSLPHLLTDSEIRQALKGMYSRLRPGGGCIITMRDYDQAERGRGLVKPYGVRESGGTRYLVWQVWGFEGDHYDLSMYFVADDMKSAAVKTHVMRSRYYAVSPDAVVELMRVAGFSEVQRLDGAFFQPVLVGRKCG
ncbi:class I SAM-dependent methyltransferase [Microbulbifer yueqingensis]|uniref:Methyltransferase domain-containing protein n=1 Tax=Microbulbifer yueqingensis TaxID=658219 RepID=A0A1G8XDW3_9GAMM|nr:class I SAM-dependent methyltransferase [Microbulbifer yueqingensis]SDJ88661.1 Methyltransferase domain-containing protein [Microbulbifer yueqingensis]